VRVKPIIFSGFSFSCVNDKENTQALQISPFGTPRKSSNFQPIPFTGTRLPTGNQKEQYSLESYEIKLIIP
jgi:hypothetical protein